MSVYDPHRIFSSNSSHRRHKGQVIQSRLVDRPVTIDKRLVPIYRDFLLSNGLISLPPPPPPPLVDGIVLHFSQTTDVVRLSFSELEFRTCRVTSNTDTISSSLFSDSLPAFAVFLTEFNDEYNLLGFTSIDYPGSRISLGEFSTRLNYPISLYCAGFGHPGGILSDVTSVTFVSGDTYLLTLFGCHSPTRSGSTDIEPSSFALVSKSFFVFPSSD